MQIKRKQCIIVEYENTKEQLEVCTNQQCICQKLEITSSAERDINLSKITIKFINRYRSLLIKWYPLSK
jgi:hypothetical protein